MRVAKPKANTGIAKQEPASRKQMRDAENKGVSASTKKRQKTEKISEAVAWGAESQRIVLVGTYRKDQFQKWILSKGLYNYAIHAEDTAIKTAAPDVRELWLYLGKAAKRRFSATFEREVSVPELAEMGYPRSKAKPHADRYLLFRVAPLEDDGFQRRGAKAQRLNGGGARRLAEPHGRAVAPRPPPLTTTH